MQEAKLTEASPLLPPSERLEQHPPRSLLLPHTLPFPESQSQEAVLARDSDH